MTPAPTHLARRLLRLLATDSATGPALAAALEELQAAAAHRPGDLVTAAALVVAELANSHDQEPTDTPPDEVAGGLAVLGAVLRAEGEQSLATRPGP